MSAKWSPVVLTLASLPRRGSNCYGTLMGFHWIFTGGTDRKCAMEFWLGTTLFVLGCESYYL